MKLLMTRLPPEVNVCLNHGGAELCQNSLPYEVQIDAQGCIVEIQLFLYLMYVGIKVGFVCCF